MTTAPLERYTIISAGFDNRVHGIGTDQWDAAVPSCPEWDVRALVAHLIGTHHMMLSALDQSNEAPGPDDDLVLAWTAARQGVLDALAESGSADKVVQSPFGEMTFAQLAGGLLCGDTLFHTWDLAHATGQDETLDATMCAEQLEMMVPLDELIRMPGFFGEKLDAPEDADVQARLLTFGGRQP